MVLPHILPMRKSNGRDEMASESYLHFKEFGEPPKVLEMQNYSVARVSSAVLAWSHFCKGNLDHGQRQSASMEPKGDSLDQTPIGVSTRTKGLIMDTKILLSRKRGNFGTPYT